MHGRLNSRAQAATAAVW